MIPSVQTNGDKFDLIRLTPVRMLLRSRWPQLILRVFALLVFLLAILAGILGTPVGSHNFGIVIVWIAWWALLMLIAVPFFGRGWCNICPIPMPGEWLQQGTLLSPGGEGSPKARGLAWRWPNRLRGIWLQNAAFLLVALFSVVVLTNPRISALVLTAFIFIATATSLLFERRAFCRYLCPVGGFIGLYSQVSPLEVRVKQPSLCAAHTQKTCYTGNADGYGCPWQVFPTGLVKNTYCGMCMECLRTCPHDNIAVNLRPFGSDLRQPVGRKLDEAFKAFIMLGSALVYSAVMLGQWGVLKSAAYAVGSFPWLEYALAFLVFLLAVLPGLFYLAVAAGRIWAGVDKKKASMRELFSIKMNRPAFISLAFSLVPLGLAAWIAFSLSFVFANLSYLWRAISDPLGLGWNLFGTAYATWTPYLTRITPWLQAMVLLLGLAWASVVAQRIAAEHLPGSSALRQALPVMLYCLVITAGLLGLLLG